MVCTCRHILRLWEPVVRVTAANAGGQVAGQTVGRRGSIPYSCQGHSVSVAWADAASSSPVKFLTEGGDVSEAGHASLAVPGILSLAWAG